MSIGNLLSFPYHELVLVVQAVRKNGGRVLFFAAPFKRSLLRIQEGI